MLLSFYCSVYVPDDLLLGCYFTLYCICYDVPIFLLILVCCCGVT